MIERVVRDLGIVIRKDRGGEWKGCCPFHHEKTPSFYVNENLDVWHCFGCGAKGNMVSFVSMFLGLGKEEAKTYLANKYGLKFNMHKTIDLQEREVTKEHAKYLYSRGLDDLTIKRYRIYSYGDAIVFPFINTSGEEVGNTKRFLTGDKKYMHTSGVQMDFFYGENIVLQEIIKKREIVLVEGVFDAIVAQRKFKNTVALLGTKLNEKRIARLLDWGVKHVVLWLDGDDAGKKAARDLVLQLTGYGFYTSVMLSEKDPDETILTNAEINTYGGFEFLGIIDGINAIGYVLKELKNFFDSQFFDELQYEVLKNQFAETFKLPKDVVEKYSVSEGERIKHVPDTRAIVEKKILKYIIDNNIVDIWEIIKVENFAMKEIAERVFRGQYNIVYPYLKDATTFISIDKFLEAVYTLQMVSIEEEILEITKKLAEMELHGLIKTDDFYALKQQKIKCLHELANIKHILLEFIKNEKNN